MTVAKNVLKNSASIAKAEVLYFLKLFWRALWKTIAIVGGLIFTTLLISWLLDERPAESAADVIVLLVFMVIYSLILSGQVALFVAGARVTWAMAGAFILVPLILIPLAVLASFWLFWGFLGESAQGVIDAMIASGADHDWLVGKIGPAARIGPPILIIALPLFAIDLLAILVDGPVLWSLILFLLLFALIFLIGFLPSAFVSLIAVVIAYVKRFAGRHEERLAKITATDRAPTAPPR